MAKAVALLSGGLDSTLAVLILLQQGIEVTALTFLTNFGCDISDTSSCSKNPYPAAEKFGFTVKLSHLSDKFIAIVKNPKYGHGRNMNPCMDCRILMLKEAKQFMDLSGADFLVTGEVLGQRPMSQRRDTFPVIDREAGVTGLVVRPLSARLMKPTRPELAGLVDREKLFNFSGRSRKPQIGLAREFGLTDYPAPAGGCLLTDPVYAYRLQDLLSHTPDPATRDINLLRTGRHFRVTDACKIIIGRNDRENRFMESLVEPDNVTLRVENVGSPLTLITGPVTDDILRLAASLTARYSDAKRGPEVEVTLYKGMSTPVTRFRVKPADTSTLESYRIERKMTGTRT